MKMGTEATKVVSSSDAVEVTAMEPKKKSDLIIFLDIDETLVCPVPFKALPHLPSEYREGLQSFTVQEGNKNGPVHVYKRPHLDHFLKQVSSRYSEVNIFTARQKLSADEVLDHLDSNGTIFTKRYYADSLTRSEEIDEENVKNVLKLDVDVAESKKITNINPKRFVVIDNNQWYMSDHMSNGILIEEFHVGVNASLEAEDLKAPAKNDDALLEVLKLLEELDKVDDVRPVLDKKFNWPLISRMAGIGVRLGATPIGKKLRVRK